MIETSLKKVFSKEIFISILVVLLLAIPTFKTILRPGYFPTHDDFQAIRLLEMDKCVNDHQLPCRWVPDMGYGYGYPQFNYYAPAPYYFMEAIHRVGFGYLDSAKVFIVLLTLLSSVAMFLFARSIWGNAGGVVSSVLYTYLPYRAVDMFVRGTLGELVAMAVLPFLFLSAVKITERSKNVTLLLALSIFFLFTSHNIAVVMVMPFWAVWFAFLLFKNGTRWKAAISNARSAALGTLWGLGLSAFFWVPAWAEKQYVHIDTITSGYFNYLAHFLDLKQIFFSNHWGYGTSQLGPADDIFLGVGIVYWVLPIVSLFVLLLSKKRKEAACVGSLVFLSFTALFLTHSKSTFIWNHIDTFKFIQFPWRFLLVAGFSLSAASGAITKIFQDSKKNWIIFSLVAILVFILYGGFFKPKEWQMITDRDKFSGSEWTKQITASIYDYLPVSAKKAPDSEAPEKPEITEGEVLSGTKGTDWQKWEVRVDLKSSVLKLQIYYFPGWVVFIDGKAADINYDNQLGLITVPVSSGMHTVEARLTDTPVRKASNITSALSLAPFLLLLKRKNV